MIIMSSALDLEIRSLGANNGSAEELVPVLKSKLESLPQEILDEIVNQLLEDAIMLLKMSNNALNDRIRKPVFSKPT
ncbi:MAG: hypothetical protein Q9221_007841 [Calogaya cf. arnoldii]